MNETYKGPSGHMTLQLQLTIDKELFQIAFSAMAGGSREMATFQDKTELNIYLDPVDTKRLLNVIFKKLG